jgi:hypothetical protein
MMLRMMKDGGLLHVKHDSIPKSKIAENILANSETSNFSRSLRRGVSCLVS